jgi:hypothetical protein
MDPRGGDRVGEASVEIAAWLHGLGLQQYEQAFRENAIDDVVLPELTADDLKDLGVSLVGHRRSYLQLSPRCAVRVGKSHAQRLATSPIPRSPSAGT